MDKSAGKKKKKKKVIKKKKKNIYIYKKKIDKHKTKTQNNNRTYTLKHAQRQSTMEVHQNACTAKKMGFTAIWIGQDP